MFLFGGDCGRDLLEIIKMDSLPCPSLPPSQPAPSYIIVTRSCTLPSLSTKGNTFDNAYIGHFHANAVNWKVFHSTAPYQNFIFGCVVVWVLSDINAILYTHDTHDQQNGFLVEKSCLEQQLQLLVPFFCRRSVLMCAQEWDLRQLTILPSTVLPFSNAMAMILSH